MNRIFENIDFNIILRYTVVLKTVYLVAFYATILPISCFWGILSLVLTYWIDKYNLLRRRAVLSNLSSELAIEMTEMLEFVLIIFALGNYASMIFILEEDKKTNYLSLAILGILIGVVHAALPMQWVNERICSTPDNPPNI